MRKGETEYRNLWNYILAVYASEWSIIALVLFYNCFDVIMYDGITGKAVLFTAFLMPSFVLYIMMKSRKDIQTPKEFFSGMFTSRKHLRAVLLLLLFCMALFLTAFLCGEFRGGNICMVLASVLPAVCLGGFQEPGFRGFLADTLNRDLPFLLSSVLTGILCGCLYFPLWFVKGAPWEGLDFVLFLLNCVFLSILLNSLYLLAESVFACILFRSFWVVLCVAFDGLMFDNGRYTICACVQIVLAAVITACVRKRRRGREE